MTTARVSRDDLHDAVIAGDCASDLAAALGVSRASVRRAERRHGIQLKRLGRVRSEFDKFVRSLQDMPVTEALDQALMALEAVLYAGDADQVGYWPDLTLSEQQRAIFCALYAREGRVVSYDTVLAAVYAGQPQVGTRKGIGVALINTRRKLHGQPLRIESVRGHGYRLVRDPGAVLPWEALGLD